MADMKAIMQQLSMQEQYDENAKWLNSQKPFWQTFLSGPWTTLRGCNRKKL